MNGAARTWTVPRVLAAVFVVGWLAVQVAVPLIQRTSTEGARPFAWQMFSRHVDVPRFKVVAADGTETEVEDWERHLGRTRLEVNFARHGTFTFRRGARLGFRSTWVAMTAQKTSMSSTPGRTPATSAGPMGMEATPA